MDSELKKVCAWCGREGVPGVADPGAAPVVSHGICESCARVLMEEAGIQVKGFLDSLPFPVLIITEEGRVSAANNRAHSLAGTPEGEGSGLLGGDFFKCVNATLPEGCGGTPHCGRCAVRNTVMHTFQTGESQARVQATLTVRRGEVEEDVALFVTTEKVGDRVLLQVEGAT